MSKMSLKTNHSRRRPLTISGNDSQCDGVPGLLDEVDDVRVGLVGDRVPVHGQDAVADLQLPTAVRRAPLDDAAYFVRHGHTCISSFGQPLSCWDM